MNILSTAEELLTTSNTPNQIQQQAAHNQQLQSLTKQNEIAKQNERRLVEYITIISCRLRQKEENNESDSRESSPTKKNVLGVDNYDGLFFKSIERESRTEDNILRTYFDKVDFLPVITGRYPSYDHEGNSLHESITSFCFPLGSISPLLRSSMPKIHYFVSTGGKGQHLYGTCLTIWEKIKISTLLKMVELNEKDWNGDSLPPPPSPEQDLDVYIPKCVCILSVYPYLVAFREFLTQLYRLTKSNDMMLPLERYIINFCSEIPAPPPGAFEVQTTILDSTITFWCPPHNQPISWVSLPFSHLFQCLDIENIILVWHSLTLERQVLITSTQLSLLTTCSEILLSLLYPMKWSHAYIPVLPHFLVPILSAPMPFFCGLDKFNLPSALIDLSKECIVVDLDLNHVTFGPQTNALPPLPKYLRNMLHSTLEDQVGMVYREARCLSRNDNHKERGIHLSPHVKEMADAAWEGQLCLFDEAFHLFFTPEELRKNLLNGNENSSNPSNSVVYVSQKERIKMQQKQSKWDVVQEVFLKMYINLLKNYRKYLIFPSKEHEGSYGGAGFMTKSFLSSQRFDAKSFLSQFCSTQMFDYFVTKRMYGSGEPDVIFFDEAMDQCFSVQKTGVSSNISAGPLLQSGVVRRKLKTIVPPEPSAVDLPVPNVQEGVPVNGATVSYVRNDYDDISVVSHGSASTGVNSSVYSIYSMEKDKNPAGAVADEEHGIGNYTYHYNAFPESFADELLGKARPLSSAVLAEFDRQRENAAKFRRKTLQQVHDQSNENGFTSFAQVKPTAEVATFTVFFLAFTSVVGKELKDISIKPQQPDKTILSTYVPPDPIISDSSSNLPQTRKKEDDEEEPWDAAASLSFNKGGSFLSECKDEEDGEEEINFEKKEDEEKEKLIIDNVNDDDDDDEDDFVSCEDEEEPSLGRASLDSNGKKEPTLEFDDPVTNEIPPPPPPETPSPFFESESTPKSDPSEADTPTTVVTKTIEPRSRFNSSLTTAQILEAKATAKAQLSLAFQMLQMMRQRNVKADPVTYKCLIDACGRCGDTDRATELLSRMHEDGIVADGAVYSCLVNAFSSENAWKKLMGNKENESLPQWANGNAVEMDWNKLNRRTYIDLALERFARLRSTDSSSVTSSSSSMSPELDIESGKSKLLQLPQQQTKREKLRMRFGNLINRVKEPPKPKIYEENKIVKSESQRQMIVTEPILRQISLGENLLELLYPNIVLDADTDNCPRCRSTLTDDDIVAGWHSGDAQDYTTTCPYCKLKFVSHFSVQCTASTFIGSKGPSSPLYCERLSPWVLQKELRTVMSNNENFVNSTWRDKETKNAVLWWNLVLSFMRYRLPFTFLLQGNFGNNLIAPSPEDEG